jgi:hypothetical protein
MLEICALLGCYAASCGNCLPTFRDNVSVPSSQVKSPSSKQLPHDAACYPGRAQISSTSRRKPEIKVLLPVCIAVLFIQFSEGLCFHITVQSERVVCQPTSVCACVITDKTQLRVFYLLQSGTICWLCTLTSTLRRLSLDSRVSQTYSVPRLLLNTATPCHKTSSRVSRIHIHTSTLNTHTHTELTCWLVVCWDNAVVFMDVGVQLHTKKCWFIIQEIMTANVQVLWVQVLKSRVAWPQSLSHSTCAGLSTRNYFSSGFKVSQHTFC